MLARKCDRCGEFYECYGIPNKTSNGVKTVTWETDKSTYWTTKNYDLCPECMDKLEQFLENQEAHNET